MSYKKSALRNTSKSTEVGLIIASGTAPRSLQKSLMDRDTTDQSIITGASMAVNYGVGTLIQDVLDGISRELADENAKRKGKTEASQAELDAYSLGTSAVAMAAGFAADIFMPKDPNENLPKAGLRTGMRWLKFAGIAGTLVSLISYATDPLVAKDDNGDKKTNYYKLLVIPAGVAIALGIDRFRLRGAEKHELRDANVQLTRSLAVGSVIAVVLGAVGYGEKRLARLVDDTIAREVPILRKIGMPLGHTIALGGFGFGVYQFLRRTYRKIENGNESFEESFTVRPTDEYSSGGKKSAVRWQDLSLQGRRHVGSRLHASAINEVMGITNAKEPIRLYVGFESAQSEEERVALALKELKRSGAFDRKYICVISPTGTGYVNYQMSESLEYMTRGDVASIALQYSLRPSPLSLDQVPEGHVQHRMMLNAIKKEVEKLAPAKRPNILIFGESLGAWTSQDAFAHQGTDGFEVLNIHRALWIGTPFESKWKEQVLSFKKRLDTNYDAIGTFNDIDEFKSLPKKQREAVKYFMLTHDNDPVALFSSSLLIKEPRWLSQSAQRPATVPQTTEYRPAVTFFQTVIDMKNALKPEPGVFKKSGHDYSGDLAEFVNAAYDLGATTKQLERVEAALRQNDIDRARALGEI